MKVYPTVICNASIFAGMTAQEIEAVLHCLNAKKQNCKKGEHILRAGESVASVGLLISGSALIFQDDFWGNRNLMARIMPGQIFAESFACLPHAKLNVNVAADEDSEILWLNINRLLHVCPSACSYHSRMIQNLLSELAAKNLRFNEKLTHMSQRSTKEKLLSYLSAEAQRRGLSEFDIPFSRQQLADYLAVERSAMSAELCKLRDGGYLSFHKNHFILYLEKDRI